MNQPDLPDDPETCRKKMAELRALIGHSRSPALFGNAEALRAERLLAHPVRSAIAPIALGAVKADTRPDRIVVAQRLIHAYHKAIADEHLSPLRRNGEDIWTRILREELPPLLQHVESGDATNLAAYLLEFGAKCVWFGGVSTAADHYGWTRNPALIALLYYDKLVCLAESLGLLRHENPEQVRGATISRLTSRRWCSGSKPKSASRSCRRWARCTRMVWSSPAASCITVTSTASTPR